MSAITLDGSFRVWSYGVGHSQLLLHHRARIGEPEHVNVLFVGVRAVKLRSGYEPLVMRVTDGSERAEILDFADVPERFRHRHLALALPTERDGFVVCAHVTVLAVPASANESESWRWPPDARVLNQLRQPAGS